MKRDPGLQSLSHDHHHSLVLVRRLRLAVNSGPDSASNVAAVVASLSGVLAGLEPHFAIEEELLLPGLDAAGQKAMTERLLHDHAQLRTLLRGLADGPDCATARALADALEAHVRFEERELFPFCEQLLPRAVLDAVRERYPVTSSPKA